MLARTAGPLWQIGEWIVDPGIDTISRGEQVLKLEPRTMRLLVLLAAQPGAVISIEQMLNEVWAGVIVGPASVYQAVSRLRRLLEDTDPDPTYIATVPRKGYRLVAPVKSYTAPSPPSESTDVGGQPGGARARNSTAATPLVMPPRPRHMVGWMVAGTLLVLVGVVLGWGWRQRTVAAAPPPAIVVLPFMDLSATQQDQSIGDGLTEELSNWLAQIPTLRVVARTTAFAYRGKAVDVRSIGQELGTTHVLEGSLRREGNTLRITAQLISTRDGYHVWSQTYDRPIDDVLALQEEIARQVADNLEIRLTTQSAQGFAARRGGSGSPQAYQLYLLARHHESELTRNSNDHAIELYEQALQLDPKFALAYAWLAFAYANQPFLNDTPVHDVVVKAEPLLTTALRLDPQLPEIYMARGALLRAQGQLEAALRDLRHATELNPNDTFALAEMGRLYLENGNPRDALTNYRAASALDPLNFNLVARQCVALTDLARFEDAERACERARDLAPDESWAELTSSWLETARGNLEEALKYNAMTIKATPNEFATYEGRYDLLMIAGRLTDARALLEQARKATGQDEMVNVRLARVAFYEKGPAAARMLLDANGLESSSGGDTLLEAGRLELLLNNPTVALRLLQQAQAAKDFPHVSPTDPWFERQGSSTELDQAEALMQLGNRTDALAKLTALDQRLTRMRLAGMERGGLYMLMAQSAALQGHADDAMAALDHAFDLGWRASMRAEHDPAFQTLAGRADFRQLLARMRAENAESPALARNAGASRS